MTPKPQYYRSLVRLRAAAEREKADLFKGLPKECAAQVRGVAIRFDAEPTPAMLGRGVDSEAFSAIEQGKAGQEIVVFLLNLSKRYGAELGGFRRELRRTILKELADVAGIEVELGD